MMRYFVEPIGTIFTDSEVKALGERFTERSKQGYEFHSVFQVTQPGCMGLTSDTVTYLAVYVSKEGN